MTAGSRQHVAVIKSKEIGKRGREEKKKCLSGDFAKKKKKKKKKKLLVFERKMGG